MAYRRFLPSGTELDYVKGLSDEERKELGYKKTGKSQIDRGLQFVQNDEGYFQKMPSFDGKSLDDFLSSDRKYYDSFKSKANLGSLTDSDYRQMQVDAMAGTGPRANFFAPLRAHGIGIDELPSLARSAGLNNINSLDDIQQLIAAKDARHTSEPELEEALADFSPARPDTPTPEDEPEDPGYSLSIELNDAIDRSRDFQEKRMAGEIFGNNLPGSIDIDSDPNTGLLYAAARGMGDRLRNYKNA